MCSDHNSGHWIYRRQTGWRLTCMRLASLGLMLFIGIGIPELVKAF